MSVEAAGQPPSSLLLDAVRKVGEGAIVRGTDLLPRQMPGYVGLEPVGGRWLRLDTSAGSALIRAEAGLSLDHDRGGLRIHAGDGREYLASESTRGRSTRSCDSSGRRPIS